MLLALFLDSKVTRQCAAPRSTGLGMAAEPIGHSSKLGLENANRLRVCDSTVNVTRCAPCRPR